MSGSDATSDGRSVDAAFNRVLAAEADARESLADCRREAEQVLAAAELAARAIAARAERRIQAAHRIADRGIARALAALDAPTDVAEPVTALAPVEVDALAAALAAELTGGAQ